MTMEKSLCPFIAGLPNWSNSSYCRCANLIFLLTAEGRWWRIYIFRNVKWPAHTVKRLLSCLLCKKMLTTYLYLSGHHLSLYTVRWSTIHSLKPHKESSLNKLPYKLSDLGAINAVENIKSLGKQLQRNSCKHWRGSVQHRTKHHTQIFFVNSQKNDYHTKERSQMELDLLLLRQGYRNTLTHETFF